MRRTAEEAKRRFSDSYNALMTFDNDDLAAMDAEIDDAFDEGSSSEEEGADEESTRDKELRRFDMPRLANYPSRFPCSLTRLPHQIWTICVENALDCFPIFTSFTYATF